MNRAARDHGDRIDASSIRTASASIDRIIDRLEIAKDADELRGLEGMAAAEYFGAFNQLIIDGKENFRFEERSRRPPLDPVNALLSFVYTLLAHDVASAIETVGLDPAVGFLHRDRPGRPGLALDLMEEFRPVIADRLALSLINRRQVEARGSSAPRAVPSSWMTRRAKLFSSNTRTASRMRSSTPISTRKCR